MITTLMRLSCTSRTISFPITHTTTHMMKVTTAMSPITIHIPSLTINSMTNTMSHQWITKIIGSSKRLITPTHTHITLMLTALITIMCLKDNTIHTQSLTITSMTNTMSHLLISMIMPCFIQSIVQNLVHTSMTIHTMMSLTTCSERIFVRKNDD